MAEWLSGQGVQLVVCAGSVHHLRPTFLERLPDTKSSAPLGAHFLISGAHPIEDVLSRGREVTAATRSAASTKVSTAAP